jgi:hypothetical protein
MADTVFVGSHIKAEAFAGQNGDPEASSLLPGQQPRRGTVAKSIMKGTDVTVPGSDWRTRTVSTAPIKANPGTKGPSTGAKVPGATIRRANDGLIRPTRR